MKKTNLLILSTVLLEVSCSHEIRAKGVVSNTRPNLVVIMCDDVSSDMFGCYGNLTTHTPHIDCLAENGVAFATAWNSAISGPARAQIMTGKYATQTGFWYNGFTEPMPDGSNNMFSYHTPFSKILKDAGYTTATAGKWHIGGAEHQNSLVVGFDEYCMWEGHKELKKELNIAHWDGGLETTGGTARYWHPCIVQNGQLIKTGPKDFGPDIQTEFICRFIEKSAGRNEPFLAYYPMTLPHGPYIEVPTRTECGSNNPEQDSSVSNSQRFDEMVNYVDILVGRIVATLERSGVMDNTVIIFTADNGTAVTAKSRGVERGCHIPMIVSGKGVKKRGITEEICDATDILPTLLELAHTDYPEHIGMRPDGKSMVPFLIGKSDRHKDMIHACIGSTQLLRTRTHLLEVYNPMMGATEGRFYYCGHNHDGRGYVRAENQPEHEVVRQQMFEVLRTQYVGLTKDHPFVNSQRAARFLKLYMEEGSKEKHLHNHKSYVFYDEQLKLDSTAMWHPSEHEVLKKQKNRR